MKNPAAGTSDAPPPLPRDAATLALLRDGVSGLEVLLLKRHGLSDAFGGAYVFPGGKLDDADSDWRTATSVDSAAADLHGRLGEPALTAGRASGLFVAACREAFEEAGVLLATGAQQHHVLQMQELVRSGTTFYAALATLGLRLHTEGMVPWTRWITPVSPMVGSRRFDTRFFLAQVPAAQQAEHDRHETTDSVWLQPAAALQAYARGEMEFAPPQLVSLADLARHQRVDDALRSARQAPVPVILPLSIEEGGVRYLCLPGDPQHPVEAPAFPGGPHRLVWQNRRFQSAPGGPDIFHQTPSS